MSNEGKKVKVHYIGTLDDGTKFDSSYDRGETLDFTCMAGQMIPGFDAAVKDMEVGQTINVRIPAADAYGEWDPRRVVEMPLDAAPGIKDEKAIGDMVLLRNSMGQAVQAKVYEYTDTTVKFDLNGEMAGKDLNFEITLVEAE